MNWYKSSNNDSTKPSEIDETSSKVVVYIRKDFAEVPTLDIDGKEIGTHWEYMEKKVKKEDWEIYTKVISNEGDITDAQLAICELYEMITEV